MGFSQRQGSLLLKLIDFTKMGHCARSLLEMYLMLVVGEIVRSSLFKLLEMYMLDTSLQFGLQVRAQTILLDCKSTHISKF